MKTNHFTFLASISVLFLLNVYKSVNGFHLIDKRDFVTSEQIVSTFNEISSTITELKNAQQNAGSVGSPDFQKATRGLGSLSQLAESAESQLNRLETQYLDDNSEANILQSLQFSARDVSSITNLIVKNKNWFDKNKATQTVITILQLNENQFSSLFQTLHQHIKPNFFDSYSSYENSFLGTIRDAISELSQSNPGVSNKIPGYESCYKSATTFLNAAYSQKSLGTSQTSCSSMQQLKANTFVMPENALMLEK